jgi:hypothetical protein
VRQEEPIEPGTLVAIRNSFLKAEGIYKMGTVLEWQYAVTPSGIDSNSIIYKIFVDCRIIEFLSPVWTITPLDEACVVS